MIKLSFFKTVASLTILYGLLLNKGLFNTNKKSVTDYLMTDFLCANFSNSYNSKSYSSSSRKKH